MKQVMTKEAPEPVGPYSQALIVGDLVFCSGQIGLDPATGVLRGGTNEQARQALMNLGKVLEAAGSSLSKAVKVTVFLTNISDMAEVNRVYAELFPQPYPARTAVQVVALPKGASVEIDLIARR
ncbi:MAG: Rid family detoxifying hydrolase [Methanomassiliicoccales archaeon]|nr:Rid family detoxifying hydrolase [Methanomassiliicoccales archaeon]